jgi:hypothetical protein
MNSALTYGEIKMASTPRRPVAMNEDQVFVDWAERDY